MTPRLVTNRHLLRSCSVWAVWGQSPPCTCESVRGAAGLAVQAAVCWGLRGPWEQNHQGWLCQGGRLGPQSRWGPSAQSAPLWLTAPFPPSKGPWTRCLFLRRAIRPPAPGGRGSRPSSRGARFSSGMSSASLGSLPRDRPAPSSLGRDSEERARGFASTASQYLIPGTRVVLPQALREISAGADDRGILPGVLQGQP